MVIPDVSSRLNDSLHLIAAPDVHAVPRQDDIYEKVTTSRLVRASRLGLRVRHGRCSPVRRRRHRRQW